MDRGHTIGSDVYLHTPPCPRRHGGSRARRFPRMGRRRSLGYALSADPEADSAAEVPQPRFRRDPLRRQGGRQDGLHRGLPQGHRGSQSRGRRARGGQRGRLPDRRDSPQEQCEPGGAEGRDHQVRPEPEAVPDGAHALRGDGVHELLALRLRAGPAEYRDHRRRHAGRPGERRELVAVGRQARAPNPTNRTSARPAPR